MGDIEALDFRIFNGYKIYEDGSIVGKYGREISKRIHNGRYEIRLVVDGERKSFILSRLIYWIFVEKFDMEDKNLCVCAKDDNFLNVHPSNLYLEERKNLIQGEKHKKRSKLTDEQIAEILAIYKPNPSGMNQYDEIEMSYSILAKKYGVSKANIAMVVKKRSRNPEDYKLR